MRIKTQFIITMLLFGIILAVIAASAIITNQQTEKVDEQEKIASSIAVGASELSYLSNDYLIYRESQQLKRWQSRFASFSTQVAGLNAEKPEQQVLVRNIQANEQRLTQVFDSVASTVGGPSQKRSSALDLAFLQVSWSRMAVQSQGLVSDASRLAQLLREQMDQLRNKRAILMYAMVGLFGLFLLASYRLTYRRILKSIVTLRAGAAVIGSGNLDFVIEEKKNDEIGDLSSAFNQMTTSLKAVTASKADLEREVIERKKAEEELRRSQILLVEAEKLSHTGAWEWDLTKDQWTFSDEWLAIHGCTKRLLTSEDLLPIAHPEDRTAIGRAFEEVRNGVRPYDIEHRIIRQDTGEVRTVQGYGQLVRDVTGTPIKVLGVAQDITERKQAEEELRQQREWLRVTLSSIGDAVIASDTEGRITFLNPVAVTLTGWQSEEALGQPIQSVFRIINEKTRKPAEDLAARVLHEKRVVALANDTALVTRDGREVPIEDSAAPIKDSSGNAIGVVLVFHDVTERRRAQAALREAHERAVWLARFPDENPNPVLRASADGIVLYCNPATSTLSGWTCEVGQPVQNRLFPLVGRAMAEGREVQEDVQLDGKVYIVWAIPFPQEGYANVYGRDITDRKQMEEQLRQSEEKSRLLIKYAPSMFYEIDFHRPAFKSVNDTMCQFLGYTREELLAMSPFDLLDDEGKTVFRERIRRRLAGEAVSESVEYKSKTKDGREVYGVLNMTFTYKDGKLEGAVVVAHDITERKRAEEALRERTLQLQQLTDTLERQVQERAEKLEVTNKELRTRIDECQRVEIELIKSQSDLRRLSMDLLNAQEKERKLVAGEIHDSIGSSLSAVKFKVESALTELADRNPPTATALKSLIPIVQGAIDEARRIQMNLRPSTLDDLGLLATLRWLCRQFESTYSAIGVKQNIEIKEHEVPDSLKTVIFRILQEGLNNIAKHSRAKAVLLFLQKTEQAIKLALQDNGQGFDLSKVQSPGGTPQGLGLKSMRERAELSGGSFEVESTQGKGTVIRVSWSI